MSPSVPLATQAAADRALVAVAGQLLDDADAVAAVLVEALLREVPEVSGDPLSTEETRRSVRAALVLLVGAWRRGAPPERVAPPPEVQFQIGVMARDGIPIGALLRIGQVAHGAFADVWDERLAGLGLRAEVLAVAMRRAHQLTFQWFTGLTRQLSAVYEAERERLARTPERVRREAVDAALSGRTVDVDALSRTAAYEFRRRHVGLVLWRDAPVLDGVPAVADPQPIFAGVSRAVADALGAAPPLVVAAASGVAWAWIALRDDPDPAELRDALEVACPPELSIAHGDPAPGLPGFRATHEDALAAAGIAMGSATPRDRVVSFAAVELVALAGGDRARARRFVARHLGPLAAAGAEPARLRATVRVHLQEHEHRGATAARLGVHPNTVSNRVRAAEELIGRPLRERSLELRVALELREQLDADFG
ncbi:hypothetical protein GKE82_01525 [Conexibacter sp. W3-3-2]|uniref:PucR family transcriptional regulator n=1 Tax=Conexibacter sp. W3-3-2 TaxID=2675227 RepID=UPI0012B92108|nr:helix-turn-helix domain-containing protein [Conexibacter sp. W3-3-2]MTD43018.1 hypothetical protein [Conexibacter sp. W3-3-2]